MAAPAAVARKLRATARKIDRIAEDSVMSAASEGVELAIAAGGRFAGRALVGDVVDVSNRKGISSATLIGRSAGGWSIKSNGRRGGYEISPKRKKVLDLRRAAIGTTAARSAVVRTAVAGDDRWNRRVADPVRERFPDLARLELRKAIA